MKKFIINADDFGLTKDKNIAIRQGFLSGVVNSTSIIVNMPAFENAVNEILPEISNIDLGFHFNIMEGKSLTKSKLLTDKNGFFNNNYIQLIIKSYNDEFLFELEQEFRAQIEKIIKIHPITHLDSHVHVHAIPNIFKMFLRLAEEYDIKYIRTQKEIPYIMPSKLSNYKFYINIIKNILLNIFTAINLKELNNTDIKTNDYFIGVLYSGFMSENTIKQGLLKLKEDDFLAEVIFHPTVNQKAENFDEFQIIKNSNLKKFSQRANLVQTSFSEFN